MLCESFAKMNAWGIEEQVCQAPTCALTHTPTPDHIPTTAITLAIVTPRHTVKVVVLVLVVVLAWHSHSSSGGGGCSSSSSRRRQIILFHSYPTPTPQTTPTCTTIPTPIATPTTTPTPSITSHEFPLRQPR